MKLIIEKEKNNPYLKRKEVEFIVDHMGEATPSRVVLQKASAKELGAKPEKVEIKNIFSIGGLGKSNLTVFIWNEKTVPVLEEKASEEAPKEEKAAKVPVKDEKEDKPKEAAKEEKAIKVPVKEKKEEAAKEETTKNEKPVKDEKEDKPKEAAKEETTKKEASEKDGDN